jgi:acyl-coenzyme A thioesterase PaaI-like protein
MIWRRNMKIRYDEGYDRCYVCGKGNPEGLQLDFDVDDGSGDMRTRCTFSSTMQGFDGIVHGGFVSMLLDEVMAKACLERGIQAVTAKIEVRFSSPVMVGEEIEVRGRILEERGRRVKTQAECTGKARALKAKAEALFVKS